MLQLGTNPSWGFLPCSCAALRASLCAPYLLLPPTLCPKFRTDRLALTTASCWLVTHLQGGDSSASAAPRKRAAVPATAGSSSFGTLVRALLPLLIILAAVYYQVVYKAAKA